MLIDTGAHGSGDEICKVATRAGVTDIDILITTHYHSDHFGGVDELDACGLTIGQAFDRDDWPAPADRGARFEDYVDTIEAVHQTAVFPGQVITLDPEVMVTVIAVDGNTTAGNQAAADENDASVAVLVSFGEFTAFYGGDIEQHTEQFIADNDLVMDVDLYQANHHGSHTSSIDDFMEDLSPSVIIISNGSHRTFAHPRAEVLDRYEDLASSPDVYQMNIFDDESCANCHLAGNLDDEFILDLESDDGNGSIDVIVRDDGTFNVEFNFIQSFPPQDF